jgi:hypothetical protein
MWRAANEGSERRWGAPSMLELAVIQREYPDESFYLSRLPVGVQKAFFAGLAVLGRAWGYRASRGVGFTRHEPLVAPCSFGSDYLFANDGHGSSLVMVTSDQSGAARGRVSRGSNGVCSRRRAHTPRPV